MAHGMADFGIYAPKETNFNLADLADLAVRLGSIVDYDRRGDVIFLDDYDAPSPKFDVSVVLDCTTLLSDAAFSSGGQAVNFKVTAGENRYAGLYYWVRPVTTGKHGVKATVNFYGMRLVDSHYAFRDYIAWKDGWAYPGIRINPKAETVEYWDPTGNWTTCITGLKIYTGAKRAFHNVKSVFDLATGKYVRLLFDTEEWDLSAYSFQVGTTEEELEAIIECLVTTLEAVALDVLQDDFVYSINEP